MCLRYYQLNIICLDSDACFLLQRDTNYIDIQLNRYNQIIIVIIQRPKIAPSVVIGDQALMFVAVGHEYIKMAVMTIIARQSNDRIINIAS